MISFGTNYARILSAVTEKQCSQGGCRLRTPLEMLPNHRPSQTASVEEGRALLSCFDDVSPKGEDDWSLVVSLGEMAIPWFQNNNWRCKMHVIMCSPPSMTEECSGHPGHLVLCNQSLLVRSELWTFKSSCYFAGWTVWTKPLVNVL